MMPPTVSPARFERGVVKLHVHRVLLVHDGGDGLEGDPKENRLAVGNAALNAAGTVRGRENGSAARTERIVVLAAREQDAAETGRGQRFASQVHLLKTTWP